LNATLVDIADVRSCSPVVSPTIDCMAGETDEIGETVVRHVRLIRLMRLMAVTRMYMSEQLHICDDVYVDVYSGLYNLGFNNDVYIYIYIYIASATTIICVIQLYVL
jgi:hypothetical protein